MSLYTDNEEFKARREELEDQALEDLTAVLKHLFGVTALRSMTQYDWDLFRDVLRRHAGSVVSRVEGYYVHESLMRSEESALNTVRGVMAGLLMTKRDKGEPEEPWIEPFVLGESDKVEISDDGTVSLVGLSEKMRDAARLPEEA